MGIEPTWDFVEPHAGFEDQERHQVAPHLRAGSLRDLKRACLDYFRPVESRPHLSRFERQVQSELVGIKIRVRKAKISNHE
jgi:hypothetical protein